MFDLRKDPNGENADNQVMYDDVDNDSCGIVKACSFDTIYGDRLDDNFGNFDIQAAKDYLRKYAKKLQSEHQEEKRRRFEGNRDPHSIEHVHEMGKTKSRSVRTNNFTPLNNDSQFVKPDYGSTSIKNIVDRLYEKSREMQISGKQRREKIVRMRELSHLLPDERPSLSAKVHSIHSLRSPDSLAQAHIVDRLYGRSYSMKQDGKRRRELINSKILSKATPFNMNLSEPSPTFTDVNEDLMYRTAPSLSLKHKEVIDRLYEKIAPEREYGRKRREEIETRALSQPRIVINKATTPSSSTNPTKRMSCTPPMTRRREYPSPDEVMNRLYARSLSAQKDGRERRELFAEKSHSMFRLYFSPTSNDTKMTVRTKYNGDCEETRSPDEVAERLYGRSYQYQLMGQERREEIDNARALSNLRSPVDSSAPTTTMPLVKSARPRQLSSESSSYNNSPSPEEVAKRLYDRSTQQQQAGKERRERAHKERCMSLPRLNVLRTTPAKCDHLTFSTTSPKRLTYDNFDRRHGRSLRNVRKDEISHFKRLSNELKTMKVRESSPAPHNKVSSDVTTE